MTSSHLALIQKTAQTNGGEISAIVKLNGKTKLSYNLNQRYEAASVAKLGIVAYTFFLIDIGAIDSDFELVLKKRHKRQGTGVLQYFRTGFRFSVSDAIKLMLIESDNTATNVLLDSIGPQTRINRWLSHKLGIATTGLTDREDCLFESDVMLPTDMMTVLEHVIRRPVVAENLSRSHFIDGLRGFSEKASGSDPIVASEAKIWGRIGTKSFQRGVLERIFQSTTSPVAALKEGILPDFEGHDYLHEVGKFFGYHEPLVVVCTRDIPADQLAEIGQAIKHWCQRGG